MLRCSVKGLRRALIRRDTSMGQRVGTHAGSLAILSAAAGPPEDPDPWAWPLTRGLIRALCATLKQWSLTLGHMIRPPQKNPIQLMCQNALPCGEGPTMHATTDSTVGPMYCTSASGETMTALKCAVDKKATLGSNTAAYPSLQPLFVICRQACGWKTCTPPW